MSYQVTATLGTKSYSRRISWLDDDAEAILEASFLVMNLAHQHPRSAWALGEITLTNGLGKVIEKMPAKEIA
jgi:hypothetical protein